MDYDFLQRSGFFEQMSGAIDDRHAFWNGQGIKGCFVKINNLTVEAANNKQSRCADFAKPVSCKIGTAAP